MNTLCSTSLAVTLGLAANTGALTFECRWVERVGNTDVVIGGNGTRLPIFGGTTHRIRLQCRVSDDAMGPAPAGGFVGWNAGTLGTSVFGTPATHTRTPGRIAPFNFATQPGANGNPITDPFTTLTDIDATLGMQTPFWGCDASGNPLPQPAPVVRGRNTFVSVYEITIQTTTFTLFDTITVGGNLIAATEWNTVGLVSPPECNPNNPIPITPGVLTYAPDPTTPVPFMCTLLLENEPAPGAASVLGLGVLLSTRRRRQHTNSPL